MKWQRKRRQKSEVSQKSSYFFVERERTRSRRKSTRDSRAAAIEEGKGLRSEQRSKDLSSSCCARSSYRVHVHLIRPTTVPDEGRALAVVKKGKRGERGEKKIRKVSGGVKKAPVGDPSCQSFARDNSCSQQPAVQSPPSSNERRKEESVKVVAPGNNFQDCSPASSEHDHVERVPNPLTKKKTLRHARYRRRAFCRSYANVECEMREKVHPVRTHEDHSNLPAATTDATSEFS